MFSGLVAADRLYLEKLFFAIDDSSGSHFTVDETLNNFPQTLVVWVSIVVCHNILWLVDIKKCWVGQRLDPNPN